MGSLANRPKHKGKGMHKGIDMKEQRCQFGFAVYSHHRRGKTFGKAQWSPRR